MLLLTWCTNELPVLFPDKENCNSSGPLQLWQMARERLKLPRLLPFCIRPVCIRNYWHSSGFQSWCAGPWSLCSTKWSQFSEWNDLKWSEMLAAKLQRKPFFSSSCSCDNAEHHLLATLTSTSPFWPPFSLTWLKLMMFCFCSIFSFLTMDVSC